MEAKDIILALDEKLSDQKKTIGQLIDEKLAPGSQAIKEIKEAQEKAVREAEAAQLKSEELANKVNTIEANSTAVRAKQEAPKTAQEIFANLFKDNIDEIKKYASKNQVFKMEHKNVGTETASNNLTGAVVNSYSLTPAVRGRQKVHYRDLAQIVQSATGLWSFYRQNAPVGEGSFTSQTTHGNAKSQVDYDLTKVDVTAEYLAGFARIARQMATDLPFLMSFISNELVEDYLRAEDDYFYSLWLAATAAGPSSSTYAEKIIQAIANIYANDGDPSTIVVTPANWAVFMNTKPTDYGLPGGNALQIDSQGRIMVTGIPVSVVPKRVYRGTDVTLVGDFSKTAIIQTDGLSVQMFEQDSDNVQKNLVTVRAEARVGQAILRPELFCAF